MIWIDLMLANLLYVLEINLNDEETYPQINRASNSDDEKSEAVSGRQINRKFSNYYRLVLKGRWEISRVPLAAITNFVT